MYTELGLQRIEAQHSLSLSRQLGTPNIASKGKLLSRTALVPLRLYPSTHPLRLESEKNKKPLIQEIEPQANVSGKKNGKSKIEDVKPKGILKNASNPPTPSTTRSAQEVLQPTGLRPKFDWKKEDASSLAYLELLTVYL